MEVNVQVDAIEITLERVKFPLALLMVTGGRVPWQSVPLPVNAWFPVPLILIMTPPLPWSAPVGIVAVLVTVISPFVSMKLDDPPRRIKVDPFIASVPFTVNVVEVPNVKPVT